MGCVKIAPSLPAPGKNLEVTFYEFRQICIVLLLAVFLSFHFQFIL